MAAASVEPVERMAAVSVGPAERTAAASVAELPLHYVGGDPHHLDNVGYTHYLAEAAPRTTASLSSVQW